VRNAGVVIADAERDPAVAALEKLLEGVDGVARTIAIYERRWPFLEYLHRYPDLLSPEAADRSKKSAEISREEFLAAYQRQEEIRRHIDSMRDQADGFISLTAAAPAPVGLDHTGDRSFQIFWTLTGAPSFTLPRLSAGGLPVGLQIMGFRDSDAALAGTAHWIDALLAQ
jgi:Asp-tRNA(Asn)/Glu-tRNA(Gln) amidotransferase A subunit family amidase